MNSDAGGIITRKTIGKVLGNKNTNKQAFFAHFQTAGHRGFIIDTEIKSIGSTRQNNFWKSTVETCFLQGLKNIDPYH